MSCQGECNYQQIRGENIIHEAVVTLFTVQLGMFVWGMIDEMMGGWSSGWLGRWLGRMVSRMVEEDGGTSRECLLIY